VNRLLIGLKYRRLKVAKEKARTTDEIENENEQEICWLCGIPGADTIINMDIDY